VTRFVRISTARAGRRGTFIALAALMSGEYEVTVDVTRLDATPNPAPLDAELTLEARESGRAVVPSRVDVLFTFARAPRLAVVLRS
jgi:hypothetical protein